jgi:hypothetical protein
MRKLWLLMLLAMFAVAPMTGCEAEVGDPGPNGLEIDVD